MVASQNVKVVKGIGGGCDKEAIRVIEGMPKWKPGKQDGQSIRQQMVSPINFKFATRRKKRKSKN